MRKIVLFDMDGTLTKARANMEWKIAAALADLQDNGFEIGIVSGSDMDYIEEQCQIIFDNNSIDYTTIHYLPCNGTKYYRYIHGQKKIIYEKDIRNEIGNEGYRKVIIAIVSSQYELCKELDFPLTGNFISYRGSMINWCPIGRSAEDTDRKAWAKIDIDNRIRSKELLVLASKLKEAKIENIIIKLGGETSFDIYPQGWDKTYAFQVFENFDDIYFVGDRCKPNGNDYEAYKLAENKGYETTGPERTIEIIREILKRGSS